MLRALYPNLIRQNKTLDILTLIVCVVLGIASVFAFVNYAGFWADESYMALNVKNYDQSPLGLLTFYIGSQWTNLFGLSILNLRYLASVESLIAVAVTTLYLFRKTGDYRLCGLSFLFGCILMKLSAFPFHNWDSGIYIFDAIAVCLLVSVITSPTGVKYFLLGFTIGLITMGRVPSAIFLPLAMCIVIMASKYHCNQYSLLKALIILFGGWLTAMIILAFAIAGSPFNYLGLFREENIITGHSLTTNRLRFYNRLTYIIAKFSTVAITGVGTLILAVILPYIRKKIISVPLITAWIGYCILLTDYVTNLNLETPFMLGGDLSVGLGLIVVYPVYNLIRHHAGDKAVCLKLWAIIALLFSMAFGSDAFFERMTVAFSIPLIIAILYKTRIRWIGRFVRYTLCLGILVFGGMMLCYFKQIVTVFNTYGHEIEIAPYNGIIAKDEWEPMLIDIKPAVEMLRRDGEKFAVLGPHYPVKLVYDPPIDLPFQVYHEQLYKESGWEKYKDEILAEADAIVYVPDMKDLEEGVLKDLEQEGFNQAQPVGKAVILRRR